MREYANRFDKPVLVASSSKAYGDHVARTFLSVKSRRIYGRPRPTAGPTRRPYCSHELDAYNPPRKDPRRGRRGRANPQGAVANAAFTLSTDAELDVVFLCTGNRFRSPMAAALFARATEGLPVQVRSRGTLDIESMPAFPEALEEAAQLGFDLSSHRTCRLAGEDLSQTDLVLGFERIHVAAAVIEAGADRKRTFTLPELVELLATIAPPPSLDPIERARAALQAAHDARPPAHEVMPELADPIGRPRRVQRETARRVRDLVDELSSGLFGR